MSSRKVITATFVASALATALSAGSVLTAPGASAAEQEKCYGVAMKGQNDCAAGAHSCQGQSTVDFDPNSFKLVPTGTCLSMTEGGMKPSLKPMDS